MEDLVLRCNNQAGKPCRTELKVKAVVTTCSHVLCEACAKSTGLFDIDPIHRQCPVCQTHLPNRDDAVMAILQPTEEYKTSILSGLDPATIVDCASRALAFWNYQAMAETAYQKYMCRLAQNKYQHLNTAMDKIIDEANVEISKLNNTIAGMKEEHHKLQTKLGDFGAKDRERTKRYNDLRIMYDTLKKKVIGQEQLGHLAGCVEHTNNTPVYGTLNHDGLNTSIQRSTFPAPTSAAGYMSLRKASADPRAPEIEQLSKHQRAGSSSQYSGELGGMLPPRRAADRLPNGSDTPLISPQRRTTLPGTIRANAGRPQMPPSAIRPSYGGEGYVSGNDVRQNSSVGLAGHARHGTAAGHGIAQRTGFIQRPASTRSYPAVD